MRPEECYANIITPFLLDLATQRCYWIFDRLVDQLTHPDFFARGQLVVLRFCNSLLRKLSKSCHTEFCGRVLMLLAAIFPLAEKSALNLAGKVCDRSASHTLSRMAYYSAICALDVVLNE
jgi:THO complex subunit 1 transcription elongation factor